MNRSFLALTLATAMSVGIAGAALAEGDRAATGATSTQTTTTQTRTQANATEARTVESIAALPSDGMVQVSGTIQSIEGEDEFILSDNTGRVEVNLEQSARTLNVGDRVTVRGEADSAMLSGMKEINNATLVDGGAERTSSNTRTTTKPGA